MDLPTYTSIWRIEKRLYKLYDFRLPMPLPIGQITVFAAITVPYVLLLTLLGLPFNHTLIWLYVLPPGVATWLITRPVLEGKRLPELIHSQTRYLAEPRVWCRLAPLAERDVIVVTARVWQLPEQARAQLAERAARPRTLRLRAVCGASARPEAARTAVGPAGAVATSGARGLGVARPASNLSWRRGQFRSRSASRSAEHGAGPAGLAQPPAVPRPGRPAQGQPIAAAPGQQIRAAGPQAGQIQQRERLTSSPSRPLRSPTAPPTRSVRPAAPPLPAPAVAASAQAVPPQAVPAQAVPQSPVAWPQTAQPAVVQPAVVQPAVVQPAVVQPAVVQPVVAQSVVAQSVVAQSVVAQSVVAQPPAARPGNAQPPVDVTPAPPERPAEPPQPEPEPHAEADLVSPPAEPAQAEPAAAQSATAEPAQAEPLQAEPAQAEPAQAEPLQAEPAQAELAATESGQAEPMAAEPAAAPGPVADQRHSAQRPVVTVVNPAGPQETAPPVERALAGPSAHRAETRTGRVTVVPGGHRPGKPDQLQRDRARAQLAIDGSRRLVVLGCTVGAGQTIITLLLGEVLASLRPDPVVVLDLNPGPESLAYRAQHRPALGQAASLGPSRLLVKQDGQPDQAAWAAGPASAVRAFEQAGADHRLVLADPSTSAVPRLLGLADQLVLVAPASAAAAQSIAMTYEWLEAHEQTRLAASAIMVMNGVSRPSLPQVEQAERVGVGRCRAIVRIPWDDQLKAKPNNRVPASPAGQPATQRWAGVLGQPTVAACTALAGVLVAVLAEQGAVPSDELAAEQVGGAGQSGTGRVPR